MIRGQSLDANLDFVFEPLHSLAFAYLLEEEGRKRKKKENTIATE